MRQHRTVGRAEHPAAVPEQLERLGRALRLAVRHAYTSAPLPPPLAELPMLQFKCVRLIGEREGCKLVDVARRAGASLPSASRAVDKLVRQELVERQTDLEDRRAVRLALTPQARRLMEQTHAAHLAHLAVRTDALDAAAIERIIDSLDLLAPEGATEEAEAENDPDPGDTAGLTG